MEDRQRVFIRGVEDRGNEVIETLVNLGGKNNLVGVLGNNSSCIYFINHDGYIKFTDVCSETGKIIVDYYQEIKLPKQWNDGDILINNNETYYRVFCKYYSDSDTLFYAYNMSMNVNGVLTYTHDGSVWEEKILSFRGDYRLATPSEVECFQGLLHNLNKDWDVDKKRLVKYRWKPGMGEIFWVVSGNSHIVSYDWNDSPTDNEFFNFGNCFKTKEEAEAMVEKIRKLMKGE